ncbi:MAG: hypothetical protein U1F87_10335 [Kiritimatiellia bacterium]
MRFRQIRRGYVSFWILCVLILMAGLGPVLVGNRALAVRYNGNWVFPVLSGFHSAESLGMSGGQECDYRLLKLKYGREGAGKPRLDAARTLQRRGGGGDGRDRPARREGRLHRPG